MDTTIRSIDKQDLKTVVDLMTQFAAYEKLDQFLEVTEERLEAAMFGDGSFVEGLIAENGGNAVGYAIFYPNFLTFRGQRGFFLEDLYVSENFRTAGLGKEFLTRIAKIARQRGFERIDFLVLDWNETAVRFYEKLGAVRSEGESHFKLTDRSFCNLANG